MKKQHSILILMIILSISCASTDEKPVEKIIEHKSIMNQIQTQYLLKNYSRCINMIDKAGDINEYEKSALIYIKAHCNYKLKDYNNAIKNFKAVISFLPFKYEIQNNIGASYFYKKDFTNALNYFNMAKNENPHYKPAVKNFNVTMQLLALNKPGTDITGISPYAPSSLIYIVAGWCNYYIEKNTEAIYYFKKAITGDPEYVLGYMSLGMVYSKIFNDKTALKYYKEALEIDDEYPDLWNNIGITYYNLNNIAESKKSFNKAIELNSHYANPYNNLAFILINEKNILKAIENFNKAVKLNDHDPILRSESLAGLSLCYYYDKDLNKAKKYKKEAIKTNNRIKNRAYLKNHYRWNEKWIDAFIGEI